MKRLTCSSVVRPRMSVPMGVEAGGGADIVDLKGLEPRHCTMCHGDDIVETDSVVELDYTPIG